MAQETLKAPGNISVEPTRPRDRAGSSGIQQTEVFRRRNGELLQLGAFQPLEVAGLEGTGFRTNEIVFGPSNDSCVESCPLFSRCPNCKG